MIQRLQKILSSHGVASRRRAEQMIEQGRVSVNGNIASLGDSADPETDTIVIDGAPLPRLQKPVYILLNKPRGYVTTLKDEKGRPDAASLVTDCGVRVYPVGRLDMDSEGLLLFTNDGVLANRLLHPSQQVDKTYRVWVRGYYPQAEEQLRRPVVLDGYRIAPPTVRLLRTEGERALLEIIIHEGRNRQIRRMCAMANLTVVRLQRIQEGTLMLGKLPLGAWRYLTQEEVQQLQK